MRWQGNRKSRNVEDRRAHGQTRMGMAGGGLLRLLPLIFRILGVKGTLIAAACLLGYGAYTGNLNTVLGLFFGGQPAANQQKNQPLNASAAEKQLVDFVAVVLADTEDTWSELFKGMGKTYQEPKLVLFRNSVRSACGMADAAVGPFYCPADQQVYIDLSFFDQLKNRFNVPGDFAQAYVIAHEVGHHIQTLLGISKQVHAARAKLSEIEGNKLSVKQELQADCLAGIWAHHADANRKLLETGDVEEGLKAASAIGDDTLQRQSRGYVTPDSFTHGSSEQRVYWFKIGMKTGAIRDCDTFKAVLK